MATCSSTLAWRTPWTGKPGGLQSMGSQKSETRLKWLSTYSISSSSQSSSPSSPSFSPSSLSALSKTECNTCLFYNISTLIYDAKWQWLRYAWLPKEFFVTHVGFLVCAHVSISATLYISSAPKATIKACSPLPGSTWSWPFQKNPQGFLHLQSITHTDV